MITKKRKRKKSKLLFSILTFISFSFISGFLIFSNLRLARKIENLIRERERLEKEIEILEEKKEVLKSKILSSKSEDFLEERLREQGYQRPGEKQIIILPPEKKIEKEKNFFQNFFDWIRQKFGK